MAITLPTAPTLAEPFTPTEIRTYDSDLPDYALTPSQGIPQSFAPTSMTEAFGENPWDVDAREESARRDEMLSGALAKIDKAALDPEGYFKGQDMSLSLNPIVDQRAATVDAFLRLQNRGERFDTSPNDLANDLTRATIRQRVAHTLFGGRGADDDDAFFLEIKNSAQNRINRRDLERTLAEKASTAAIVSLTDPAKEKEFSWLAFREEARKAPGYTPDDDAELYEAYHTNRSESQAALAPFAPELREVWTAMKAGGAGSPSEIIKSIGADLLLGGGSDGKDTIDEIQQKDAGKLAYDYYDKLPEDQREGFLDGLAVLVRQFPKEQRPALLATWGKQFGSVIDSMGRGAASRFSVKGMEKALNEMVADSRGPFGAAPEQRAEAAANAEAVGDDMLKQRNFVDAVRRMESDVYAPTQFYSAPNKDVLSMRTLESGFYGSASVVASVATMATPYIGLPVLALATEDFAYSDLRDNAIRSGAGEMEASRFARDYKTLAAAPSLAIEILQNKLAIGKIPAANKVLIELGDKIRNRLLRGVVKAGAIAVPETAVEEIQYLIPYAVQDLASALEKDTGIPAAQWSNGKDGAFDGFWTRQATTFISMLPIAGGGAIGGMNKEARNAAFAQSSTTKLLAYGGTAESIAAINAANGPASLNAAVETFLTTRDPFSDSARQAVEAQVAEELAKQGITTEATASGILPRFTRTAAGWTLHDSETGAEIGTAPNAEAALRLAQTHTDSIDEADANRFAYMATMLEAGDFTALTETLTRRTTTVFDTDTTLTVTQKAAMSPEAAAKVMSQTQLREKMEGGDGTITGLILGDSSTAFENRQRRTVNRLNAGASVLTVFHEETHGFLREAYSTGRLTQNDALSVLRALDTVLSKQSSRRMKNDGQQKPQRESLRFLPADFDSLTDKEKFEAIDEAISELMESEVLRTRKGTSGVRKLPPGLLSRNLAAVSRITAGPAAKFRAFARALRSYFGIAIDRAAHLDRALKDGTINQSLYNEFLTRLLGLEEQAALDQQARDYEQEIIEGTATPEAIPEGDPFSIRFDNLNQPPSSYTYETDPSPSQRIAEVASLHGITILERPSDTSARLADFERDSGIKVVFYRWQGKQVASSNVNERTGAFVVPTLPGVLFINAEAPVPLDSLLSHELIHSAQRDSQSGYADLEQTILALLPAGDMTDIKEWLRSRNYTEEQIPREIIPHLVGSAMSAHQEMDISPLANAETIRKAAADFYENATGFNPSALTEASDSDLTSMSPETSFALETKFGDESLREFASKSGLYQGEWRAFSNSEALALLNFNNLNGARGIEGFALRFDVGGNTGSGSVLPSADAGLDTALSLGPAALADAMRQGAIARIRDPQRRVRAMANVARKMEQIHLVKARLELIHGSKRAKASLRKEAAFREASLAEQYENEAYARHYGILDDDDLRKIKSQPVHAYLSDPDSPLRGTLMSKSRAIKDHPDLFRLHRAGDYDGSDGVSRSVFGGTRMPDQAAQDLYDANLIKEPTADALWQALLKEQSMVANMKELHAKAKDDLRSARTRAKQETNEWLAQQERTQDSKFSPKQEVLSALALLDAILFSVSPEIRGKVGGYTQLAQLGSDEHRLTFLTNRLEKVDTLLEQELRTEFGREMEALLKRARPQKDAPGEKPKGTAGSDVHDLFREVEKYMSLPMIEAEARAVGLESQAASGELTPEQESHSIILANLLRLAGDWTRADAARRESAVTEATRIFAKGYIEHRIVTSAIRERRQQQRTSTRLQTGKKGNPETNKQNRRKEGESVGKVAKSSTGNYFSFAQILGTLTGDNSETMIRFGDWERRNSDAKADALEVKTSALESLLADLGNGGSWAASETRRELQKPNTITIQAKHGEIGLSQMEAVGATLMWMQEDGRRHMEGRLDDAGNPVGAWHYSQRDIDAIESQLTAEAKSVRVHLQEQYAGEYDRLNPVYRDQNGVNLPRNKFYSPLTVKPQSVSAGQEVDPVTGFAMASGRFSPGSLKNRSQSAVAEPDFRDALTTYLGHIQQIEHYIAYAAFNAEASAIFRDRDTRAAMEERGGAEALNTLDFWLEYFGMGGIRQAGAHLATNRLLSGIASNATSMALIGRITVPMVQSVQLLATWSQMSTASYMKRIGKLFTFQLDYGAALQSPYMRRRLNDAPPAVRDAMNALLTSARGTLEDTGPGALFHRTLRLFRHTVAQTGRVIPLADYVFTSASYAIIHDKEMSDLRRDNPNLEEGELHRLATANTERTMDIYIAQPMRPGARSAVELQGQTGATRLIYNFISDPRQKIGGTIYKAREAAGGDKRARLAAARMAFVHYISVGTALAMLRAAMLDARRDEDDDEWIWDAKRLGLDVALGPLQIIPFLGEEVSAAIQTGFGERPFTGTLLSSLSRTPGAAEGILELFQGESDPESALQDIETLLNGIGLFSRNASAATSVAHIIRDLFNLARQAVK